jgi:hypothetical protein
LTIRGLARSWAGPGLIVTVVLLVLGEFAFQGRMNTQHVDPLSFWLPMHCHLGAALREGAVPLWNPHVLSGVPFAADPQSGWMYLPAMALYAALPCHRAMGWFIALQPVLAGLGIYAFLRVERLSRPAATVGGLMLAVGISASRLAVTLPFSATLAWTALLLAAAARFFRAEGWPGRMAWAVAMAACWGQVAAAHLSHGLVLATAALAVYGIVASGRARRPARVVLLSAALLVVALPLVNLAFLLPRLPYLARSTLSLGYHGLDALAAQLAGRPAPAPAVGAAVSPAWVLGFATSPGAYLGVIPLALAFAGWRLKPLRGLVLGFGAFAAACYLLSLRVVAQVIEAGFSWLPFSDFYLHEPSRFRYGVLLALPVLAAAGVEAWRHGPPRMRWLLPGAALPVLAGLAGADLERLVLPAIGLAIGGGALWVIRGRPALAALLPAVLTVELGANAFLGQARTRSLEGATSPPVVTVPFNQLVAPTFGLEEYLRPGLATAIRRTVHPYRFLSLHPGLLTERGYLEAQEPEHWGLLANQRAMLFGLRDAQGYNPVQPLPYWMFVRAVESKDIKYNAAFFIRPPDVAVDLLDVRGIVGSHGRPPFPDARPAETTERWTLSTLDRRSTYGAARWRIVPGHRAALRAVTAAGFDPATEVILEEDPGTGADPGTGPFRATVRPDEQRIEARTVGAGVLVLPVNHDPGWRATVDGRPARVVRADSFLVGVPVPAGRHRVALAYTDPMVTAGLLGSALAVAILLGGAAALRTRDRRAAKRETEQDEPGG